MQFALVQLLTWKGLLLYGLLPTHTRAISFQKATALTKRKGAVERQYTNASAQVLAT